MSVKVIARLIPPEYRREILVTNMITTAVATSTDANMHYLCTIWSNYVEPGWTPDCNLCCSRVLTNYKNMIDELIQLEKESQLLNEA